MITPEPYQSLNEIQRIIESDISAVDKVWRIRMILNQARMNRPYPVIYGVK